MNQIEIRGKKYTSPENWDEMDLSQAKKAALAQIRILTLARIQTPGDVLYHERNLQGARLVRHFMKMSPVKFIVLSQFKRDGLAEISKLNDFVFQEFTSQRIFLPSFKHKGREYFSPSSKLYTSTIEEFGFAERFFEFWNKDPLNDTWMSSLVAVLYRPKGNEDPGSPDFSGDFRQPFNKHSDISRANLLARISPELKALVLLQYMAARKTITQAFPRVFSRSEEGGSGGGGKPPTWSKIALAMSGGKFGTYEQTKKNPGLGFSHRDGDQGRGRTKT